MATITQMLPPVMTTISIPVVDIDRLPDGAGYHSSNGRLLLGLTRQGDSLLATARMDSLERRITVYERERSVMQQMVDSLATAYRKQADSLKSRTSEQSQSVATEAITKPPEGRTVKTVLWSLMAGIAVGVALMTWLTRANPFKLIFNLIKTLFKNA